MLIDWIKVAVSLLTDDSELIEEYLVQLRKLAADGTDAKAGHRRG